MRGQGSEPGDDPFIGQLLADRYRVVRLLGEGGMGRVYEGEHVEIGRRVAIKCLTVQGASRPEALERFRREALAATAAGNEHIVEVTDMGRLPDGTPFMVLEYIDGRDLEQEIARSGPLSVERVASIACQICDALSAAHAKGIVHRDLKPSNVFLTERSENPDFVKVLDFGISKYAADASDEQAKLTKTGAVLGTPYFMSPEQVMGKRDVDHRADIFALGGLIHYALTASYPFGDGDSLHAVLYSVCNQEPAPLATLRPEIPADIVRSVQRALNKSPAARFASCAEMKAALSPHRVVFTLPPPFAPEDLARPSGVRLLAWLGLAIATAGFVAWSLLAQRATPMAVAPAITTEAPKASTAPPPVAQVAPAPHSAKPAEQEPSAVPEAIDKPRARAPQTPKQAPAAPVVVAQPSAAPAPQPLRDDAPTEPTQPVKLEARDAPPVVPPPLPFKRLGSTP